MRRWGLIVLLAAGSASAGTFRGGALWWRVPDPSGAPRTVELTVTSIWDDPAIGSDAAALDFGDGSTMTDLTGAVIASGTTTLGSAYTVHQIVVAHTYPANGAFTAVMSGCCRHATANNSADDTSFRISANVVANGVSAGGPEMLLLQPQLIDSSDRFSMYGTVASPEGISVATVAFTPELATPSSGDVVMDVSAGTNDFHLDWLVTPSPLLRASYEIALVATHPDGGSSSVDAIIEIGPASPIDTGTPGSGCGGMFTAVAGQEIDLPIPANATLTGAPASATEQGTHLVWTPSTDDVGSYRVIVADVSSGQRRGECEVGVAVVAAMQCDACAAHAHCQQGACVCDDLYAGDGVTSCVGDTGCYAMPGAGGGTVQTCCVEDGVFTGCHDPAQGSAGGAAATPPEAGGCAAGGGAGGMVALLALARRRRRHGVATS